METVKLIIDRKPVEVPKGTTILDAAKGMGIRIPTLCYMKLEDLHYEMHRLQEVREYLPSWRN